jgi:hypothetical protein
MNPMVWELAYLDRQGLPGIPVILSQLNSTGYQTRAVKNDEFYLLVDTLPPSWRFVTGKENNRNRRNSKLITAFGETKTSGAWPEDHRCKVNNKILMQRISRGWNPEMAISHIPYKQ